MQIILYKQIVSIAVLSPLSVDKIGSMLMRSVGLVSAEVRTG